MRFPRMTIVNRHYSTPAIVILTLIFFVPLVGHGQRCWPRKCY